MNWPKEYVNQIICGDCMDVMKQLPDECADVIVTSPPYNLRNSTGNGMKDGRGGKWSKARLISGYDMHSDDMPHEEYVEWQRQCLEEMYRLINDRGAIFYNHKWRVQNGLLQTRDDIVSGFPVRQIIIWKRKGGFNFNKGYFLPTYEVIYLIAKSNFVLKPKANALGDVWEIAPEKGRPHPAPFPEKLVEQILTSVYAQLVIDPFCGSGTTAKVAKDLGLNYIGIDNSPDYCEMARDRLGN